MDAPAHMLIIEARICVLRRQKKDISRSVVNQIVYHGFFNRVICSRVVYSEITAAFAQKGFRSRNIIVTAGGFLLVADDQRDKSDILLRSWRGICQIGAASLDAVGDLILHQFPQGALYRGAAYMQSLRDFHFGGELILVLDTALANGEDILVPGGSLKYTVPLPVNFGSGKLSLYMVAEDGTMKLLDFTAADGALTFDTNQTGIFVVMEDAAQGTPPGSGETSDPDKEPGDADSSAPDTGVAPLGLAALVPPALAAAAMAASRRRRRGNGAE